MEETSDQQTEQPSTQGFSYDSWYAKNKKRLSDKRAARYRDDSAYREKALLRSRAQRKTKPSSSTDGYVVSFSDMAKSLSVTPWVLREWRRKSYFPEPRNRDNRLWFKADHTAVLQQLNQFFLVNGARVGEAKKKALDEVIAVVYANW